ncbi:MAG: zinc ribbon domain-containing protein [Gemmatimonadota bacterium]
MHSDVVSLLALQQEDDVVDAIRSRIDEMAPRLSALDKVRDRASHAMRQLQSAIEADEKKQKELNQRLADHKVRHDRNVAQLDQVKRMREATAAMAQVEMGRKVLVELESELRDVTSRINNGRKALQEQQTAFAQLEAEQASAREALAAERATLDSELNSATAVRDERAQAVLGGLRVKYNRIRSRRRSRSVFTLSAGACGNCDTALPVQRRSVMVQTGCIELCEGCGVLIYAAD